MKYRLSLLFLLVLQISFYTESINAQVNAYGNPFVVAYDYAQTGGSEWNYSIIKDDRGIVYLGNEIKGVLEFDGINFNPIRINDNPVILALEKDPEGVIYVAGPYEFGYIEPGDGGSMEYISLSERLDSVSLGNLGDVYDIQYFDENIYFVSKRTIYRYHYNSDLLDTLKTSERYFTMQRIYSVNNNLFIADNREGLTVMQGDSITLLPGGENFGRDYCFSVLPYDDEWCVVGTFFNGLYLYNYKTGEVRTDFVSEEINNNLKNHQIYGGCVLSDGNYAFGTTSAGVYIFNREGELIELYSNESLGLHDDQIYYMYHDGSPSLSSQFWMTVVEKIYHISYNLPIRFFDDRNNITYGIREICKFNGGVYVCGDKGIAKREYQGNKVVFRDIEGIGGQTYCIVPFKSADNRNFLLAGNIEGLFIIDEKHNVSSFVDIVANPSEDLNPDWLHSITASKYYEGVFYLGYNRKLRVIQYRDGEWRHNYSSKGFPGKVQSVAEESPSRLWVSTTDMDRLFTLDISDADTAIVNEYQGQELSGLEIKSIKIINEAIILVTDSAVFRYNMDLGKFTLADNYMIPGRNDIIYEDVVPVGNRGVLVSAFDYRNFDYLVKPDGTRVIDIFYLLPKSYTAKFMLDDNILWLPKQQEIFLIDLDRIDKYKYENDVLIRKVIVGGDSVLFNGVFYEETGERHRRLLKHQPKSQVPKINHSLNDITFNWSSNNFMSDDSTVYSFMVEGFDKEWSKWEHVNYKDYTNLQHGKYRFKIKSKGLTRIESDVTVYEFEIARAWYQTVFAMIIYVILFIVVVVGIIKIYTRRLINENVRLEGIVADRTKEVVRQKEELEASIHYASRIQRAILPSEKVLADKVEEYFILFRPRDIVSGDFYWISQKGSRLYIVAADCTGHGVPGAFMSILGISFLDEIINKADNTDTDKILNVLRKHVTDSLKQMEEGIEETKDGMDLGILVINYETNEIEFSGAYNPCWLVRELTEEEKNSYLKNQLKLNRTSITNGKHILETIEADRMPIGISSRMNQSFRMHTLKIEKGVSYYLLSDGYSDQFGGASGRKFLKKNLKKLILDVQGVPMKKQKDLLEKNLEDWMGDHEQVDDILVMGIRVI